MRRGFSLVEVMVAMLILLVGMVGYYSFLGTVSRYRHYSHRLGQAILLAKSRLEVLRVGNYSTLENGAIFDDPFRVEWETQIVRDRDTLKEITVKVGWGGENCRSSIDSCFHKVEIASTIFKMD